MLLFSEQTVDHTEPALASQLSLFHGSLVAELSCFLGDLSPAPPINAIGSLIKNQEMLCHSFMVHLHNHVLVHSLEHPVFTSLTHSVIIPFTPSITLPVTHSVTLPYTHLHTHACLLSQSPQVLLISPFTIMCQVLEIQLILIICRLHICQFIYVILKLFLVALLWSLANINREARN